MTVHQTEWKSLGEGYTVRATYGIDEKFAERNNQAPYIAVTGEARGLGGYRAGQIHDEIRRFHPELVPLLPWHLVAEPGVPMHYLANGQYWWEQYLAGDTSALESFKKTTLYGVLPMDSELELVTDHGPLLNNKDAPEDIRPWLESRMPGLEREFQKMVDRYDLKGSMARTANPTRKLKSKLLR